MTLQNAKNSSESIKACLTIQLAIQLYLKIKRDIEILLVFDDGVSADQPHLQKSVSIILLDR